MAQLVARYLGVVEAARSSRVTQTKRTLSADRTVLRFSGARFLFAFAYRAPPQEPKFLRGLSLSIKVSLRDDYNGALAAPL